MNPTNILRLMTPLGLLACGAIVSAQTLLPSAPPRKFGGSVTPAFEGWYDNADGTHTFLVGYYSRNTEAVLDVPVGPNNHFGPGEQDMGQPTHFLPGRRYGMFTVTVPKEFSRQQQLAWTLTANGVTTTIPFYMSPDYNISPFKSSEQGPTGEYNLPPALRFVEQGTPLIGPVASASKAITRTASLATPLTLDLWADDDARYTSGANTPMRKAPPPVTLTLSKYRGPGEVTFADAHPKMETLKGGKPDEAYSGRSSTTVRFSQPGDYMLHVTANDYSGNGGNGFVCCWTAAIVKVSVRAGGVTETGGQ
jgi:hypothetical protein